MGSLYTQMKVFHYKDKIDSLPKELDKIMAPIHIRIKPTNVCNHRCSYCAYREADLQLGQDMNDRDFIPELKMNEIIEDIIEMGVKAVTFSGGGDPFCYQYLLSTAKKLADSPVKFAALTNGARLTGEVAEVFAKNATWLRISMDGWDNASYTKFRGVKDGEFTKIINNIKEFKSYNGSCYFGVSIIVGQENANHVFELISKLNDSGIDSVKVAPCIVSNHGKENNDYHEPIFEIVKEQTAKAIKEFSSSELEIFDSYHTQLESFEKNYTWCPYSQILPIIGADQNIYPCQDKAYNLKDGLIGSINDVRFKDFWFSDKSKFFRIDPSKVCNHHCVGNGKNKIILDYLNTDKEHMAFV